MRLKSHVFDENAIGRAITRIAHEIMENNETLDNLVFVGIKTRGVPLAKRISDCIYIKIDNSKKIPVGILDITAFRDDIPQKPDKMSDAIKGSIPFDIDGKTVVLVDDVIYTGRTIRAAMDALISIGRPAKIQLAVIVDRGHRELPIRADYVGKNIPTSKSEIIGVKLIETDGMDMIDIYEK